MRTLVAAPQRGAELGTDEARALFAAMLAGEVVPDELSAILIAWQRRRFSLAETTGFMRALDAHAGRLEMPHDGPRPVLLPAYRGTRRQANLTALLALLLKRYETPVLVHGLGSADVAPAGLAGGARALPEGANAGPVTTAEVLWELGIEPVANLADAQARLRHDGIAYARTALLAPGLARLFAAVPRDSRPTIAYTVARLIDPFGGDGYRLASADSADDLASMREFLLASRADALLFEGTEGEPFAEPRRQTRFEHVAAGVVTLCADADADGIHGEPSLPAGIDAATTATWIANVLAGTEPVPPPIIVQLGCCLAGARRLAAPFGRRGER